MKNYQLTKLNSCDIVFETTSKLDDKRVLLFTYFRKFQAK